MLRRAILSIILILTIVILAACAMIDAAVEEIREEVIAIVEEQLAEFYALNPDFFVPNIPEVSVGNWERVTIEGNAQFTRNTRLALGLIRQKHPEMYEKVVRYLHTVSQEGELDSGLYSFTEAPTYVVDHPVYESPVYEYASQIVHYAVHSRQFYELYNTLLEHFDNQTDLAWDAFVVIGSQAVDHSSAARNILADTINFSRFDIEQEALQIQIDFLQYINAPEYIIEHYIAAIGTIWWDRCIGSCFCELHQLRWLMSR
ncbi:MAG: hypothetical protein FWE33_02130 [Defluviitaleaceae bacterium]|nr:hypothetical protein [Defluviitaleaceae bacterium]